VTPKILGGRVIRAPSATARRSSRNFNRSFDRRIGQAGVSAITGMEGLRQPVPTVIR
jgi:hypothetical protein